MTKLHFTLLTAILSATAFTAGAHSACNDNIPATADSIKLIECAQLKRL